MYKRRAFTLIELLVVISIIALLIAILLPSLGAARRSARQLQNSVNLRSLHQSTAIYAEENKGWYTGLNNRGEVMDGAAVAKQAKVNPSQLYNNPGHFVMPRFALLAFNDIIAFEHIVSPEEKGNEREVWDGTVRFSHRYISYAALDLGGFTSGPRPFTPDGNNQCVGLWRNGGSSETPIFSDRNTSAPPVANADPGQSVWDSEQWIGGVVWNDGHTTFESDVVMDRTAVVGRSIADDPLFEGGSGNSTGLGLRRGQHIRMLKFNDSRTFGPFADPSITP